MTNPVPRLRMFGAMWCKDCRRSKALLEHHDIVFEDIDLTDHPERSAEAQEISGRPNIPVIVFDDGAFLIEPSDADLVAALSERGLVS